jgi:hypothetical protein
MIERPCHADAASIEHDGTKNQYHKHPGAQYFYENRHGNKAV